MSVGILLVTHEGVGSALLEIRELAISGGVSANSSLRKEFAAMGTAEGWTVHIPPFAYCTDNAAMIAMAGHYLHRSGTFAALDTVPVARFA